MSHREPSGMSPLQRRIAQDREAQMHDVWEEPDSYSLYDKLNDEASFRPDLVEPRWYGYRYGLIDWLISLFFWWR